MEQLSAAERVQKQGPNLPVRIARAFGLAPVHIRNGQWEMSWWAALYSVAVLPVLYAVALPVTFQGLKKLSKELTHTHWWKHAGFRYPDVLNVAFAVASTTCFVQCFFLVRQRTPKLVALLRKADTPRQASHSFTVFLLVSSAHYVHKAVVLAAIHQNWAGFMHVMLHIFLKAEMALFFYLILTASNLFEDLWTELIKLKRQKEDGLNIEEPVKEARQRHKRTTDMVLNTCRFFGTPMLYNCIHSTVAAVYIAYQAFYLAHGRLSGTDVEVFGMSFAILVEGPLELIALLFFIVKISPIATSSSKALSHIHSIWNSESLSEQELYQVALLLACSTVMWGEFLAHPSIPRYRNVQGICVGSRYEDDCYGSYKIVIGIFVIIAFAVFFGVAFRREKELS